LLLATSEHSNTSEQLSTGGRGVVCRARLCVYIHKLPFKKCNPIGVISRGILMRCVLHFRVVAIRLLQGLGLDIPKGAIYTSGYEVIVGQD
jgi:hypothetical protein